MLIPHSSYANECYEETLIQVQMTATRRREKMFQLLFKVNFIAGDGISKRLQPNAHVIFPFKVTLHD